MEWSAALQRAASSAADESGVLYVRAHRHRHRGRGARSVCRPSPGTRYDTGTVMRDASRCSTHFSCHLDARRCSRAQGGACDPLRVYRSWILRARGSEPLRSARDRYEIARLETNDALELCLGNSPAFNSPRGLIAEQCAPADPRSAPARRPAPRLRGYEARPRPGHRAPSAHTPPRNALWRRAALASDSRDHRAA